MSNAACQFCNKEGLMLLPLRYSIAAHTSIAARPEADFPPLASLLPLSFNNDKPLQTAAYTIRMLRQGYLYVLSLRLGQWVWDSCWVVNAAGYIMAMPQHSPLPPPAFNCDQARHGVNASMIAIQQPAQVSELRLLFIPDPLTPAMLEKIRSSNELRQMLQCFQPRPMNQPDTLKPADLDKAVAEFRSVRQARKLAPLFNQHLHPFFGQHIDMVQNVPYAYGSRLQAITEELERQQGMVVVLHDPIGITQELNQWRNSAIEPLNKKMQSKVAPFYGDYTHEQLMNIINTVDTLEEQIREQRTQDYVAQARRLQEAIKRGLPPRPGNKYQPAIPPVGIHPEIAIHGPDSERRYRTQAAPYADEAWKKYQQLLLDKSVYHQTRDEVNHIANHCNQANRIRYTDLQQWLESVALHNSLCFYDDKDVNNGICHAAQVGLCIHGINSTPSGQRWLHRQAKYKTLNRHSLLLNALVLNQRHRATPFFQAAMKPAAVANELMWPAGKGIGEVWDKLGRLAAELEKGANPGSVISSAHIHGINLLLLQSGHAMLADMPGGKILDRSIARSDTLKMLLQFTAGKILSEELKTNYPTPNTRNSAYKPTHKETKAQIDNILKANEHSPQMNGTRFGVLMAFMELGNLLTYSVQQIKHPDADLALELAGASLSMTAVLLELSGAVCDRIEQSSSRLLTMAKQTDIHSLVTNAYKTAGSALRLAAGSLGMIAGVFFCLSDFKNADKEQNKNGDGVLLYAYALRGTVAALGSFVGFGLAVSAGGPLFERMAQRSQFKFIKMASHNMLSVREQLAIQRVMITMIGAARLFTVIGLVTTIVIVFWSDNELEAWCKKSCLRKERTNTGFASMEEESQALLAAAKETS